MFYTIFVNIWESYGMSRNLFNCKFLNKLVFFLFLKSGLFLFASTIKCVNHDFFTIDIKQGRWRKCVNKGF